MVRIGYAIERLRRRQRFRYWATLLPVLILAMALPLLRPLRHPDPRGISDEEWVRLEAIRELASTGRFSLAPERVEGRSGVVRVSAIEGGPERALPLQEPTLSVMGAGVYQVLRLSGVRAVPEGVLGPYLLTVVLSTLPVAGCASLLYRCARVLELSRGKRVVLALACVACAGLLPFATVLSPYPMAALCVTGAAACVLHVVTVRELPGGAGWLLLGGFLCGLGPAVHPSVAPLSAVLVLLPLAIPWRRRRRRLAGVVLMLVGAAAPVAGHKLLMSAYAGTSPATTGWAGWGGWTVESVVAGWTTASSAAGAEPLTAPASGPATVPASPSADDESATPRPGPWPSPEVLQALATFFGRFGVLTHVPAVLLGVAGVGATLIRHWPTATRRIAVACLLGVAVPLGLWALGPARSGERMYGPVPVVAVLPLLMLWGGVYLRQGWAGSKFVNRAVAGWALVAFSVAVSVVGMFDPFRRGGFNGWPPLEVLRGRETAERRPVSPPVSRHSSENESPKPRPAPSPSPGLSRRLPAAPGAGGRTSAAAWA